MSKIASKFTSAESLPARARQVGALVMVLIIFSSLACPPIASGQTGTVRNSASDAWSAIVAKARIEQKVVLYGTLVPPVHARIKAGFEETYPGIALEYHRVLGVPLVAMIEQERRSATDGADMVQSADINWFEDKAKEGGISPPSGPAAGNWPPAYMLPGGIPVLSLEPLVMVYNTKLVKTDIAGPLDLLKPELKGRFGINELGAPTVYIWYDWLEKTYGADFLPRLAAQQPRFFVSTTPAVQSLAAGELAIAYYIGTGVAMPLIEQGAPLKVVFPHPGFGVRYAAGILSWARRPNAATVFLDYLMSARGQRAWNGHGDLASPLPNIPGSLDAKSIYQYDARPYTTEVLNAYRKKWNAIFNR